ncbi:hypothetical protein F0562_032334 [Nyssa sinensis]|uniref:Uncharacterized protein n=1 Tax=Nyssa sinensis TaxID=561372 RepID=A0A5J5ATF7_9ASTE|nr:hypothetical protein F0562_032334 [Nyssa sinensis]
MNGGSSDLVSGDDAVIPKDTPQNVELQRKWKIKCGKALFALRTSISQEYIEHVRDVKSPKQVWETLERLFTQKNMMRLQFLENELAGMTQDNLSISEYFWKIKTSYSEIKELDTEEPVSDARLRGYLIRELGKEFMPFISSIQGWANQPSIIELENLLLNREALMKQMASSNKQSPSQVEDAFYTKDKAKSNSFSKLSSGANVAHETSEFEQLKWEQCLSIEAIDQPVIVNSIVQQTNVETYANASIDYSKDWIVDSSCSHHATGNASLLFEVCPYHGKRAIVTAYNSLHPEVKEGNLNVKKDISIVGGISLKDVYHVPGLKKNLASVSQMADSGRYVLFGPDYVKIISNIKHFEVDVLFTGKRKDSLYVLSASDAYVEKTGQNASVTLWHARLGHVGYQLLQKISTKKLLDGVPLFKEIHQDVICPGCQYGKSHRFPFPNSKNRATAALQLADSAALLYKKTSLVLICGLGGCYTCATGKAKFVSARGWTFFTLTDEGDSYFSVEIHHGVEFMCNLVKVCIGGKVNFYEKCHTNLMSMLEMDDMLEGLEYFKEFIDYYYKVPLLDLNIGLKPLKSDNDVMEMIVIMDDDDELYETNIDKGVEWAGVYGKSKSMDYGFPIKVSKDMLFNYEPSEELKSLDGSFDEEGIKEKAKFLEFRANINIKDIEFRLGMMFSSAKKFKDVVKQYDNAKGKTIRFVKNETKELGLSVRKFVIGRSLRQ